MFRVSPIFAVIIGTVAALLTQCNKPDVANTQGEKVLATVGSRTITATDLKQEASWRIENHQAVPSPENLLEAMVERLALVAKAERDGIADEYETRRRYETLLIARLRNSSIDASTRKIVITDDELKAAYQDRIPEFTRSAIDRFAILFQDAPGKSSDSHRAEARHRLEQAVARADEAPATGGRGPAASGFGALAIDFSDDQISRYRGGDIGWVNAGDPVDRIPNEVIERGRSLDQGSKSEVIETELGYYLIQKTDSRPGGTRPFDEVAGSLKQKLLREKQQELELDFIADALKSASVKSDPVAAKEVELPSLPSEHRSSNTPPSFPSANR